MIKRAGKAFLVGGSIGLIGQILIEIASLAVSDPTMAMMLGILIFGFVAVGMVLSGMYFKISEFGGNGAAIPVCGLMFGAATSTAAEIKSGKTKKQAFLAGFKGVMMVLGSGYALAFLLGIAIG